MTKEIIVYYKSSTLKQLNECYGNGSCYRTLFLYKKTFLELVMLK